MGVPVKGLLNRRVPTERDVLGESIERGLRSEADQLRSLDGRVAGDGLDDGAQRRGAMVLDVGGDLGEAGGGQPQADRAQPGEALVA